MRLTLGQLRTVISEEVKRVLVEEDKKDDDEKEKGEYNPSAVSNDAEQLLIDELDEEAESKLVPPEVRDQIKRYFLAMGLSNKLPKHARVK